MPFDATPTNTTADVLRRARAVIGDVPLLQIAQDHVCRVDRWTPSIHFFRFGPYTSGRRS